MFGLFKKKPTFNSPEEKLQYEMRKKIKNMAFLFFNSNPLKGTPMEGEALSISIIEAQEFYTKRSIALSNEFGVDRETIISIINECATSIYKEYLE